MLTPKFPQGTLTRLKSQGRHKKPGSVWLFWYLDDNGVWDSIWTIKTSEEGHRFFETAEAAEAYFALSGYEKHVDTGKWRMNERYGTNVVRPRGQGVVKSII